MFDADLCLSCLRVGAVYKLDRKGKPYVSCHRCGSKCFLHSREALRGAALARSLLAEIGEERITAWADARLAGVNLAAPFASAASSSPAPSRPHAPAPSPAPAA